jgi:lysozyme family protein
MRGVIMDMDKDMLMGSYTAVDAIGKVIDKEAGYVNDPDDLGGETNYGVTIAVAKRHSNLWGQYDWDGDMRTMPRAFAIHVYKLGYWDSLRLDEVLQLSPLMADCMFDTAVNCGVGRAGEWLQRILNVLNRGGDAYPDIKVDGDVGPTTMRTLQAYHNFRGDGGIKVLLAAFICMKGHHYINISERRERNESFTYGWLSHRVFEDMNLYMDCID